jgi:hypothetical protein
MGDETNETTSRQLEALRDAITSVFAELRRDMSELREDMLRTRALVNDARHKLTDADRALSTLSARVDAITGPPGVRGGAMAQKAHHYIFADKRLVFRYTTSPTSLQRKLDAI